MNSELSTMRIYIDMNYYDFSDSMISEFEGMLFELLGLEEENVSKIRYINGCVIFEAVVPTPAAERFNELIKKLKNGDSDDKDLQEFVKVVKNFRIKTSKYDYGPYKNINTPIVRNCLFFIHGWNSSSKKFKEMSKLIGEKTSCETYLYNYPTGLFSQTPPITFIARNLDNEVRMRARSGQPIGFICHSMGGVVVRKLMVLQRHRDQPLSERTNLIAFAASPSIGVQLAGIGAKIPFMSKDQLRDLAPGSPFMLDLRDEWRTFRSDHSESVRAIYGMNDNVIAADSAADDDPKAVPIFDRDHSTIVEALSDSTDDEIVGTFALFVYESGL